MPKATRIFMSLFLLLITNISFSQSFFYFEATPAVSATKDSTYFIFLTVDPDGTSKCRIRFTNKASGEQCLVEQKLKDSSDLSLLLVPIGAKKFLIPIDEADFLEGTPDEHFLQPRFVFEKMADSSSTYYAAKAVQFKTTDANWLDATLQINQQKEYKQLAADVTFVRYFYKENDAFYTYLTQLNSRGGLSEQQLKTKFYLITIANTLDKKIGISSKKDLDRVTEFIEELTSGLGIKLIQTSVWGDEFNKYNVQEAVDNIQPNSNDIVMFYYSGHGFRFKNDESKFPRMSLRTNKLVKLEDNNLSVENDVYKILLRKKAKVTIVLSDCCNSVIDQPSPIGMDLLRPRATGKAGLNLNYDNCLALFFPVQPVSILVGSAEKGQLASGNPDLGGFFTNFFLAQLTNTLYSNKVPPSWLKILINARESTTKQALTAECSNTENGRCTQRAELQVIPPL